MAIAGCRSKALGELCKKLVPGGGVCGIRFEATPNDVCTLTLTIHAEEADVALIARAIEELEVEPTIVKQPMKVCKEDPRLLERFELGNEYAMFRKNERSK